MVNYAWGKKRMHLLRLTLIIFQFNGINSFSYIIRKKYTGNTGLEKVNQVFCILKTVYAGIDKGTFGFMCMSKASVAKML